MSRIYVKDLACYKNANAGQRRAALKRLSPDNYFDLDLLPGSKGGVEKISYVSR